MSKILSPIAALVLGVVGTQAGAADDITLATVLQQDGPYIDIPVGFEVSAAPPTFEDIQRLADLDGDPSVTTDDEAAMILILMQVMIATPVTQ